MSNPFRGVGENLMGLPADMIPVTPNDSADNLGTDPANNKSNVALGLYVETGGSVVITTLRGDDRTVSVPDNFYLMVGVKRVKATGTTASGIHALVV